MHTCSECTLSWLTSLARTLSVQNNRDREIWGEIWNTCRVLTIPTICLCVLPQSSFAITMGCRIQDSLRAKLFWLGREQKPSHLWGTRVLGRRHTKMCWDSPGLSKVGLCLPMPGVYSLEFGDGRARRKGVYLPRQCTLVGTDENISVVHHYSEF